MTLLITSIVFLYYFNLKNSNFTEEKKKEVLSFLNSWANGVIAIGKEFINENDHKNCARDFILKHYNFNSGNVLFKPTFTSEKIFRNNFEDALSYFVKGHIDEDSGFAIKPWKKITILDVKILITSPFLNSLCRGLSLPLISHPIAVSPTCV